MLYAHFSKLEEIEFIKWLRAYFHSYWYLITVAVLMLFANLFSLELPVYYLYLFFGIAIVLFDDDLKGIIPIAACSYMCISYPNNPATQIVDSAFYRPSFKIQLAILLALAGTLLTMRLVTLLLHGEKRRAPRLLIGFVALGVSYILGGIFSGYYSFRTAFFGFVEIAALSGLYFFFYYAVDWNQSDKRYFSVLFFVIGIAITFEVLGMYLHSGVLLGKDNRSGLVTGWGMYNNVGCVLAICAPAPLYLATTQRRGWIYLLGSFVPVLGLILTQSRGSILFGSVVYLCAIAVMLIKSEKRERFYQIVLLLAALCTLSVVIFIFRERIASIFSSMLEQGFKDSGRFDIYRSGLEQFQSNPCFGVGFYECEAFRWGNLSEDAFLPPRYHDTYVQLLASGGIFALICYLFHRVQTAILFFQDPTLEKTFLFFSVAALILTSIVDCHFFNLGPGLLYSILLVLAEGEILQRSARSDPARLDELDPAI